MAENKTLEQVLELLRPARAVNGPQPCIHSGKVQTGDVFVVLPPAIPGVKGGVDFLAQALQNGAGVVVYPQADHAQVLAVLQTSGSSAICVEVADSRAALGKLAAAYFGTENFHPVLVGVTGTNGKTTSAYLLEALIIAAGKKCGVLGTVSYRWPGVIIPAPLTTPGCLELHELLADMQAEGVEYVVMEVSSHALEQQRIAGLEFKAALFTNLTQDHLDYHKDMESYYMAKAKLFLPLEAGGVPLADKSLAINIDDAFGLRLASTDSSNTADKIAYTFSGTASALPRVLQGEILSLTPQGMVMHQRFEGQEWEFKSPLVGAFNAYNLLGVQAVALGLGFTVQDIKRLESFAGVQGRLERVVNDKGYYAFVDYAHTPDALINAIKALRDAGFKRILTVFGCGGDRDRSKRPLMSEAVAKYADIPVLTSDNPRTEDPQAIINDALPGLEGCMEYYTIVDRKEATIKAVSLMHKGDALLVAGKGHEDYQVIGTEKIYYSDQAVLKEIFDKM